MSRCTHAWHSYVALSRADAHLIQRLAIDLPVREGVKLSPSRMRASLALAHRLLARSLKASEIRPR